MIICLEGPSAVGKTSTCQALVDRAGAVNVPEVNALFSRPNPEPANWYLERQVERWGLACRAGAGNALAVLDGDPLQPLWYNWSFGLDGWQGIERLSNFFRPLVESGRLQFPDHYFLLIADEAELRRRKDGDANRSRRHFESHLRLIETQRRYFDAVSQLAPHLVSVIPAQTLEANLTHIQEALPEVQRLAGGESLRIFDLLLEWLNLNTA